MTPRSTYKAALTVAPEIARHFNHLYSSALERNENDLAPAPAQEIIETVIDVAFWASLRKEEGNSPKISLAYFRADNSSQNLLFGKHLPLTASTLTKLAPGFERPGVHLGIWEENGELYIWGAANKIPNYCFILDVAEPGLLVVKHKRLNEFGKFTNVAVLNGDEIKIVDENRATLPGCPGMLTSLIGLEKKKEEGFVNILIQLAVSMRAHKKGGTLIIVPSGSDEWLGSIRHPISYAVKPAFNGLADLIWKEKGLQNQNIWQTRLKTEVDIIAGLTAIDGAIVMNDRFQLLVFGAKLTKLQGSDLIDQMITTEPIVGGEKLAVQPVQTGGTRHLSAAQFVNDQKYAIALVASQDGRFTIFSWSETDKMVQAHRIESLLL